jgi:hypothetical protein
MVNKPKRGKGRPAGDPNDVRTHRFSFRIHPHLYELINQLARDQGLNHSLWLERAAIDKVHRDLKQPGLLDAIGRRVDSKPKPPKR